MEAAKNITNKERPPIVVVMGHVDHGKTSLLDFIRKSNVASREAGGITQAVSAYEITHSGKKITFIDTPGHEAFTKMRSRGANIADMAILVVAAEESIKPQTQESIKILEESKTPYVVAFTKCDKPAANLEKCKADLTSAGVYLEGMGGQISFQAVSSKTGEGIPELLDLLLLTAEVEGLSYDPLALASGFVLESKQSTQRGVEVVVILKDGVLKQGDFIATPSGKGKIKILEDFQGKAAKELHPSSPAMVVGFEAMPYVGEEFSSGKEGDVSVVVSAGNSKSMASQHKGEEGALNIALCASDAGSLEVLSSIVRGMSEERPIKIVSEGVGEVSDKDVKLIKNIGGIIIAFKSRVAKPAAALAQLAGIPIISSEIVYELVKAIEDAVINKDKVKIAAEMEVLAVFSQARMDKQLFGGKITKGTLRNGHKFEVVRAGVVVGNGRVGNLRMGKKEVEEVAEGSEGGLYGGASVAVAVGDLIVVKDTK
jgi:translation initiation factor IF-2